MANYYNKLNTMSSTNWVTSCKQNGLMHMREIIK